MSNYIVKILLMFLVVIAIGQMVLVAVAPGAVRAGEIQEIEDQKKALKELGLPGSDKEDKDMVDVVVEVIRLVFGVVALVFLIMIIMAGFRWMTSDGNAEVIDKAKKTIQSALLGILVIAFAYGITVLVFSFLK